MSMLIVDEVAALTSTLMKLAKTDDKYNVFQKQMNKNTVLTVKAVLSIKSHAIV